ncbi:MAG: hypothetical protein B7Z47_05100 [Chthoniobacter sp. 12-60-6]|nr:MAG: hypothetical protein B7Z47_05100 [Chthoniobacter sp. 12-60-6]
MLQTLSPESAMHRLQFTQSQASRDGGLQAVELGRILGGIEQALQFAQDGVGDEGLVQGDQTRRMKKHIHRAW